MGTTRFSITPGRIRGWLYAILAVLCPLGGASAATFTVTNLADAGPGSLRQAVLDANGSPGADEVTFAEGVSGTITLTTNEIAISDSLSISGPGLATLSISGGDLFRIFYVENPAASAPIDVALSGLTIERGRGLPMHDLPFGGAVYSKGENLTIVDSEISESVAETLSIASPGCGGNVALSGLNGETLHIVNSTLANGNVLGGGGNLCVADGRLILEQSTLSEGTTNGGQGGGLYLRSSAADNQIVLSSLTGNLGSSIGGGAYAELEASGGLTIDRSTISLNNASTLGVGGGMYVLGGLVRIDGSTIWGNDARVGGGIFVDGGEVRLENSTVSGNNAHESGGGIYFDGSAVGILRWTTLSDNRALGGNASLVVGSLGASVELDHAIVANGATLDLSGFSIVANYSLIENPGLVTVFGSHNLTGVDPLLGPLADNGGPTLTHQPLPGSPALDTGDPAIPSPPPVDQRGLPRIVGPAIDRGSVERGRGAVEVPTASGWGLFALVSLLSGIGALKLRRSVP